MNLKPLTRATLAFVVAGCGRDAAAPVETAAPAAPPATEPVLVSRDVMFGNPERTAAKISPDGKHVGYVAPLDGVLNVYVAPFASPEAAKPVTNDKVRPIRTYEFAYDGQHVLYLQDTGGDENFHIHAANLTTGEVRDLTPFAGARAEIQKLSHRRPGEVLVALNDRNPQYFDLYAVEIATGKRTLVQKNDEFGAFVTDDAFNVHLAERPTEAGGKEFLLRDGDGWKPWQEVPQADALTTNVHGFNGAADTLYVVDSRGRDKAALFAYAWPLAGEPKLLVEDARVDVEGTVTHPETGVVQAAGVNYLRQEWKPIDPAIEKDLAAIRAALGDAGDLVIEDRTLADDRWVVGFNRSDAGYRYHLYDRASGKVSEWIETRPALRGAPLQFQHGVEIATRDGKTMASFLVLPPGSDANADGKPEKPVPMVLLPHGGPWGRDYWGLDREVQWLANRGYAVLQPNFRASTGFGKDFLNAGNMQWGKAMHDDLVDATDWAIAQGITSKDQVAIMGGSYGGYSVLAGLTFTPETFACGVDIVGPSNLITLLSTVPPYWASFYKQLTSRMGDPATEEGKAILVAASPLTHADKIVKPLLIGQGANDPRVKQAESDQIVTAMQAKNIPVTYVLFPDEGHGFARPENNKAFYAVAEQFLAKCLGGRAEPIGDDLAGSTITVPTGAADIAGLEQALAAAKPAEPAGADADAAAKPSPTP